MCSVQTRRKLAHAMNHEVGVALFGSGGHSHVRVAPGIGCPYDLQYTVKQLPGILEAGQVRRRTRGW